MKKILCAGLALVSLTSCMNEGLTVHMDYISHENLASTFVGTPDPLLETALVGQRLIISWWVPLSHVNCRDYEICLKLRYGNKEEATASFSFTGRQGWYVYALTNEEFFDKGGIKTYYVQLYAGDELLDEWKHQLWVDLIEFAPSDETDSGVDDILSDYPEDDEDLTTEENINRSNDDEVEIVNWPPFKTL